MRLFLDSSALAKRYVLEVGSREVIERLFGDIPEDQRRKIVHDNAAQLFGLG